MRSFMDSLTRRHVAVTQEMIAALQTFQAEIVAELADQRTAFTAELSDQRAALNANTQAFLPLLDERFGPERPQG